MKIKRIREKTSEIKGINLSFEVPITKKERQNSDFIKIENNEVLFDEKQLDTHTKDIFRNFLQLLEKRDFDELAVTTGVFPSPDFGYFELANRFWRASITIYFSGVTKCFYERGAGYIEPWLFNARHAVELYVKGLLTSVMWLEELQKDHLASGFKTRVKKLKHRHEIIIYYGEYKDLLPKVIDSWDVANLGERPDQAAMLLTADGETILNEIFQSDKKSFRYRYPNFKLDKKDQTESLREFGCERDESNLLPLTGLPMKAGYSFDHVKVMNALTNLVKEYSEIAGYYNAIHGYIGDRQAWEKDLFSDY